MSLSERVDDISCIVVHHNSPASLRTTVGALNNSGVDRERIVIVDNSSSDDAAASAAMLADEGYGYLRTLNRGYAAAANEGFAHLASHGLEREFTLIATHEAVAAPGALLSICRALRSAPDIAVAGPSLVDSDSDAGAYWSLGGRLSRTLKLPQHVRTSDADQSACGPATVERDWLDGAFTVYRTPVLTAHPLEEFYFLYFEETDLHTQLRRSGLKVAWVPGAEVSQSSSGIPPRLMGRNLFLFHQRHFSKARGRCAVAFVCARSFARKALTGRGAWSDLSEIVRGWRVGEADARSFPKYSVAVSERGAA